MYIDVFAIYEWIKDLIQIFLALWEMFEYSLVDGFPVLADNLAVLFGNAHPAVYICNIVDDVLIVIEVLFPFMIPFFNFPLGETLTVIGTIGIFALAIYKLIV